MATFKSRLAKIMAEKSMTQSELSRLTGIRVSSISDYLRGIYEAKQDKVFLLAEALRVNPAWLMGLDTPREWPAQDGQSEQENSSDVDKQELNEQVGSRIRQIRKDRNMTLLELADKVGLSEGTVQRYESGNINNVYIGMVQKFAEALNVDPGFLMGWKKDKQTPNIQSELEMFIDRLDPSTGLAFFNGETEMDQETRELILMSLKNTLALSQKLSQNKEKQNED